jgi:hypothetical protein
MNAKFSHKNCWFNLSHPPCDTPILFDKGKILIILYLTINDYPLDPFSSAFDDGHGKFFASNRDTTDEHKICLYHQQNNVDAVILDCSHKPATDYSKSTTTWSISGSAIRYPFDIAPSKAAGVWIPDKVLLKEIDLKVSAGIPRRTATLTFAQRYLKLYNSWLNRECYGVVQDVFELQSCGHYHYLNGHEDSHHTWGFYGRHDADNHLKTLAHNHKIVV